MVADLQSINWGYVVERIRRYNKKPSDDLLYRIGTHADVLDIADCDHIQSQEGRLDPEQRYRVLNWIVTSQEAVELECDLALLIFGRDQLTQWLEQSRQAYPDFEFYLCFEYLTKFESGYDDGICFTIHWMARPGAPTPNVECDFPWRLYWESGDYFWADWMVGGNQFDFTLHCYPSQQSFATPGLFCEEGDHYTTPTDEEKDLMSVAQVLEAF